MDNREVKRILVLELWNIGDVVLTLPFLEQLRTVFPQSQIAFAGRAHAQEILAATGLVDEFIDAELGWEHHQRLLNPGAYPLRSLWSLVRQMRARHFDIAFQCRRHVREYLLLALSGAKRRVGLSLPAWDRLLTDCIPEEAFAVQKKESWLRLLDPFGGRRQVPSRKLEVSQSAREKASRFLEAHGVSEDELLIGIHPGASVAAKRWPIERFGQVVEKIAGRQGFRALVFVDPEGYGSALAGKDTRIEARVGLAEMMALIERCRLLLCNDSGPMHLAGALGVPCVAVFSTGISQFFEPLGTGHRIVLPPGPEDLQRSTRVAPGPYDVTGVPSSRVLAAIDEVLG